MKQTLSLVNFIFSLIERDLKENTICLNLNIILFNITLNIISEKIIYIFLKNLLPIVVELNILYVYRIFGRGDIFFRLNFSFGPYSITNLWNWFPILKIDIFFLIFFSFFELKKII